MTTTFTAILRTGEVLTGTVERVIQYWTYNPVDYARICLTGERTQLNFSRDLVRDNKVAEDLWVDRLERGRVVARALVDVSGGRPHCVDLDAAGEWGEIVRRALAAVEAAA